MSGTIFLDGERDPGANVDIVLAAWVPARSAFLESGVTPDVIAAG